MGADPMILKTTASPSQGAREIAEKIAAAARPEVTGDFQKDCEQWPEQGITLEQMANLIDAELAEFVNAALAVCDQHGESHPSSCVHRLAALLERFTPGK